MKYLVPFFIAILYSWLFCFKHFKQDEITFCAMFLQLSFVLCGIVALFYKHITKQYYAKHNKNVTPRDCQDNRA